MPINAAGRHRTPALADLPLSVPLRLRAATTRTTSRACTRSLRVLSTRPIEVLRTSIEGQPHASPKFLAEKLPAQCDGIIAANPFLIPHQEVPRQSFSDADKAAPHRRHHLRRQRRSLPRLQASSPRSSRKEYAPQGRPEISRSKPCPTASSAISRCRQAA